MRAVIIGAGSHGKVVLEILREQGHEPIGWLDDTEAFWGTERSGIPVLGGIDNLHALDPQDAGAVIAIGHTLPRMAIGERVRAMGFSLLNAIHPSAVVMRGVTLGYGNCVCAGAILGTDTKVGSMVIVNTRASIDHDSVVEDGAWIAPGVCAAGGITVGRGAYISIGAVLTARVRIGEGAVVGAGAVVTRDIPPRVLALGVPARIVRPIDAAFNWQRLISG